MATPEEASFAKGILDRRAEEAGTVIGAPGYYRAGVRNEASISGLLPPKPAPEAIPPREAALALGCDPAEFHEFDLDTRTGACREPCGNPRPNWRHNPAALEVKTA